MYLFYKKLAHKQIIVFREVKNILQKKHSAYTQDSNLVNYKMNVLTHI